MKVQFVDFGSVLGVTKGTVSGQSNDDNISTKSSAKGVVRN
jgi:hypothetical protein